MKILILLLLLILIFVYIYIFFKDIFYQKSRLRFKEIRIYKIFDHRAGLTNKR